MVIKTKTVSRKLGFHPINFLTNALGTDYVDIVYRKRGRLSKFLKLKFKKRINLPKGSKIQLIENNKPKVGMVFIKYKIKK